MSVLKRLAIASVFTVAGLLVGCPAINGCSEGVNETPDGQTKLDSGVTLASNIIGDVIVHEMNMVHGLFKVGAKSSQKVMHRYGLN